MPDTPAPMHLNVHAAGDMPPTFVTIRGKELA